MVSCRCDNNMMLKLVKIYIQHNPECTCHEITDYFNKHEYGIVKNYNSRSMSALLKGVRGKYDWFNIETTLNNRGVLTYKVVE